MFSTIYFEQEARSFPKAVEILQRYSELPQIECHHYGEVFNRKQQNFRLQKQRPALILAVKKNKFVLPAPSEYHIGSRNNFYFSHMLNCIYDCRYCFLQGMYRSAHYVLFVNYDDFFDAIELNSQKIERNSKNTDEEESHYFSGYDCDSLALEPVTGFAREFLPLFRRLKNTKIELRTKSTQIRELLRQDVLENCIVAFSFSPANIASQLEHKVPSLSKRLEAIVSLQRQGWKIGLRFDPLIYHEDFKQSYDQLFASVFKVIDIDLLHSISLGVFRMPQEFFRKMVKLYPREKLFASPLQQRENFIAYQVEMEQELILYCKALLLRYVDDKKIFSCEIEN